MTPPPARDREAFEKWCEDTHQSYPLDRAANRAYVYQRTQEAFEVWQAARALMSSSAAPVAWVVVSTRIPSDGDGSPPVGLYRVVGTRGEGHILARRFADGVERETTWILARGEYEEVPASPPARAEDRAAGVDRAAVIVECAHECYEVSRRWASAADRSDGVEAVTRRHMANVAAECEMRVRALVAPPVAAEPNKEKP